MSTSPTSDLVMRLSYSECSDNRFLLTNYAFGKVLFLVVRITIEITKGSKGFNAFIELFFKLNYKTTAFSAMLQNSIYTHAEPTTNC